MKTLTPTPSAKHTKSSTKTKAIKHVAKTAGKTVDQSTQKADLHTPFALQKRVMMFAIAARSFTEKLPKQLAMSDDAQALIKVSGELGRHSIEAHEAPSKKAFTLHMTRCKKEIKEVLYWLQLLDRNLQGFTEKRRQALYNEGHELRRIFTAIVKTAVKNG